MQTAFSNFPILTSEDQLFCHLERTWDRKSQRGYDTLILVWITGAGVLLTKDGATPTINFKKNAFFKPCLRKKLALTNLLILVNFEIFRVFVNLIYVVLVVFIYVI